MTATLVLAGLFNLGFAVFHLLFWRLFRWGEELPKLSFANRGIMQVLNLCLTFVFLVMAAACLIFPDELVSMPLGRFLLASFACFWALRALYQPLFFGLKHRVSLGLFVAFLAGTVLHLLPLWG